jgi:acyl carrier protein
VWDQRLELESTLQVASFDRFRHLLAGEFEIAEHSIVRDTNFVIDLDFDSFQMFRLAIFIEMLAPIDIPDSIDLQALTVGAVYDHYAVEAAVL